MCMDAGPNPILHTLAYRPILAVDQIPEINGVRRIKAGLVRFMGLEQEMAGDIGALGASRTQDECRHMIACEAQKQIGVYEFAFVSYLFVRVETRECAPHRGTAVREGVGALAVRDPTTPIQIAAAGLAKRRHDGAEFRVNPAAVIALVIVLANDLPICGDFVTNGDADAQTL